MHGYRRELQIYLAFPSAGMGATGGTALPARFINLW